MVGCKSFSDGLLVLFVLNLCKTQCNELSAIEKKTKWSGFSGQTGFDIATGECHPFEHTQYPLNA